MPKIMLDPGGRLPYQRGGDACRLTWWCKFRFWPHFCLVPRPHYSVRPKRFGTRGPSIVRLGYVTKVNWPRGTGKTPWGYMGRNIFKKINSLYLLDFCNQSLKWFLLRVKIVWSVGEKLRPIWSICSPYYSSYTKPVRDTNSEPGLPVV